MNTDKQDDWIAYLKSKPASDNYKSWIVAVFLSFFFGMQGFDRFYLGYKKLGIIKMITAGGLGVWWIVDFIMILTGKLPDAEGGKLKRG